VDGPACVPKEGTPAYVTGRDGYTSAGRLSCAPEEGASASRARIPARLTDANGL